MLHPEKNVACSYCSKIICLQKSCENIENLQPSTSYIKSQSSRHLLDVWGLVLIIPKELPLDEIQRIP